MNAIILNGIEITIRLINLAGHIGLFDTVFDLSSLFNKYPSYQQRPYYSGGSGFGQGGFYPGSGGYGQQGGYGGQQGFGSFPGAGAGSGLGTNILGETLRTKDLFTFIPFLEKENLKRFSLVRYDISFQAAATEAMLLAVVDMVATEDLVVREHFFLIVCVI